MSNGSDKRTLVGPGTPEPEGPQEQERGDTREPPPDPLVGTTLLERYYIEKKLGEGGMGSVYLARHTTLEKAVALKVLHGEFSRKPDLIERFLQEAKAASRIRHQNVIDITDFGQTPEGLVFFAMEFLEGRDLHEELGRARLEGRPIPWQRSKKIFLQVCSALAAAHAQGVIHRDLKPENIYLVEWGGERDFVKLLDFGIAKMTEVSEEGRKLTRTGMLFGTPEYMSPEQARGEKPDARVDVYAMGCILYQLLSGRVPFESDNFMGVLSLHLSEEPPPIGPALQQVGAPPALEGVVQRALAKDREARFADMGELADAVRAADGEEGVEAPPAPPETAGGPRRKGWTGRVRVPDEGEQPAPPPSPRSSKKPLIFGAAALAALAGGFAIAASMLGGDEAKPAAAAGADAAAKTDEVPEQVSVTVRTDPDGATVMDDATGEVFGRTPITFELPGSTRPRSLRIAKDGYAPQIREIIPREDRVIAPSLEALADTEPDEVPDTEDARKPDDRKPASRKPDTRKPGRRKPASRKPDTRKPDGQKPDGQKPDDSDEPDDGTDEPKLKDPF